MRKIIFAAVAISVTMTGSAFAVEARKRVESLEITPEKVWAVIGDFCGIANWHPAVAKCDLSEKDGKQVRTLTLQDGATIVEQLTEWNEENRSYTYTILESPLPVANYTATLSTKADDDGGAGIRWLGNFDAKGATDDEAKAVIEGIYEAGLNSLLEKSK